MTLTWPIFILFIFRLNGISFADPAPQALIFESHLNDIGLIKKGETYSGSFKVSNTKDYPIKLELVKTGCDCLEIFNPNYIKAKSKEEIKYKFTANLISGETKAIKAITVRTNEGPLASYILTVKAQIYENLVVHQNKIDFGDVLAGENKTIEFELESNNHSVDISYDKKIFNLKKNKFKSGYKINLKLNKKLTSGKIEEVIKISIRNESLSIPVFANIVGPIQLSSHYITFKKKDVQKTIKIINPSQETIKLKRKSLYLNDKKISSKMLKVSLKTNQIQITLNDVQNLAGLLHGEVELATGTKTQPIIKIALHAILNDERD